MNLIRIVVGDLFQSPMARMSYPAYLNYVNTSGKITARSLMDLHTIVLTFLEEQEKVNLQNEENFKTIFEILAKLVKDMPNKVEEPISTPSQAPQAVEKQLNPLECKVCGKVLKNTFGYKGHIRSHQPKK